MMTKIGKQFGWVLLGLILTLLFCCNAANAESGTWGDLTWELDDSGTLTVSGTGTMPDFASNSTQAWHAYKSNIVSITVQKGVVAIGSNAFEDHTSLTSVTFPDTVTKVGTYAFSGCTSLTEFIIPDSVTSIGDYAFSNCRYLESISIPESVTSIGRGAFYECRSLLNIAIPDGITAIGSNFAYNCIHLASVSIPDSVTSIGDYAFWECGSVTAIELPDGITAIDSSSFGNCPAVLYASLGSDTAKSLSRAHESFRIPDTQFNLQYTYSIDEITDLLTISGLEVVYADQDIVEAELPNGVTRINDQAFRGCTALTHINIPDSVTSIGSYTFYDCTGLTEICIPYGVTSIGSYTFSRCTSLISISFPDSITSISPYICYNCITLTDVSIPNSVTSINECAFYDCSSLTSVSLPDHITSIGGSAFGSSYNPVIRYASLGSDTAKSLSKSSSQYSFRVPGTKYDLRYIYTGDEITSLAIASADTDITEVVLPDYVTSIGAMAFQNCTKLTEINIPDSITSIASGAFSGCSAMLYANLGSEGAKALGKIGRSFRIPSTNFNLYYRYSADELIDLVFDYADKDITEISLPNGITRIDNSAFSGCSNLTNIVIPDGVTFIEGYAFKDCSSLSSISFPDSIKDLEYYVFENCSSLTAIELSDSISSIDNRAFEGCSAIRYASAGSDTAKALGKAGYSFRVPGTKYGLRYFYSGDEITSLTVVSADTDITEVILPDYVTNIGSSAFQNCSDLISITIPVSITGIDDYAFRYCNNLMSITLPDNITNIAYSAFWDCPAVRYSSVGSNTAKELSKRGFSFRIAGTKYDLRYIFSEDEVTGLEALNADKDIVEVVLPDYVTSIGSVAFYNCTNLNSITIPESVNNIGSSAFQNCANLTSIILPDNLNMIDGSAFYRCTSLTSINIPENVTSIGAWAFRDCASLTSIIIPEGITAIYEYTFSGCSNMVSITIPESIASFGKSVFYQCNAVIITPCNSYTRTWAKQNSYVVEPVHPEDHIITDLAADPTCTETGMTEGSHCDLCGDVLVAQEEIPANGHTLITVEGTPATCTDDGVTDTVFCEVCGEYIQEEEIVPALGHVWTSHGANWAEDGSACHFHLICERCGEETDENSVISSVSEENTTCAEKAWTTYTATLTMGEQTFTDTLRLQDVPALPHTIEILSAVPASCTETGLTEGQKCSVCNEILTAQEIIPALGHDYTLHSVDWADDGSACSMHLMCNRCSHEEDIQAEITAEHDVNTSCAAWAWSTYNTRAEKDGQIFTDIKRIQDVEPIPHTIEIIPGHDASCSETGLTDGQHCTVCNEMVLPQEVIPALGHYWHVKQADWGSDNAYCVFHLICDRCGETISTDAEVTAEAEENTSCTEWAWTHYTATYTDGSQTITETKDEMNIPPIPHVTEILPAVPATCTESGLTEGEVCTVCGETIIPQEIVPALGHAWHVKTSSWTEDASSCLMTVECERCGEARAIQAEITPEAEENTSCTDWAWTVYTASVTVDGTVLTDTMRLQNVEPIPHTIEIIPAVEATDREPGCTEEHFCSVCGTVLQAAEEIPALWSYSDDGLTVTAYNGTETDLTIPEGVSTLSKELFKSNTSITSIRIPEGVTSLGTQSFFQAVNLREVWLPDSLQGNTITAQTFYNVSAVFHANAGSPAAKVLSYRKFDFVDQNGWTMRYTIRTVTSEPTAVSIAGIPDEGETSLTIPADIGGIPVTELKSLAAANHAVLTDVHLPDTLVTIGTDAFEGCPEGLTIYSSATAPARTWAQENGYVWAHEAHQPEILAAVAATCTEDGLTEGSWCPECGEILTAQEIVPALGHEWSAIAYTWAEDNSAVTASHVCAHNADHTETETVPASAAVTKQPTCEENGETTYTSEAFENPAFSVQTIVVANIASLGHDWSDITYTWAEDNSTVTASRICAHNPDHTETETAIVTQYIVSPTETAEGSCEWISNPFENAAFVQQTKSVTIPALNTLSVLRIPAGIRTIEEEAFEGVPAQAILIPDGCTTIGRKAFVGCTNLLYVRIPASVTSIAANAFDDCPMVIIDRIN